MRWLKCLSFLLLFCVFAENSAIGGPSGPELGSIPKGPRIDKSGDAILQKLIETVVPKFRQGEYKNGDVKLKYSLFAPQKIEEGKKLPLVLFIADASTVGEDADIPLKQGYGALVWATEEFQKNHPCFVLAPQFSGVAVNDAWQRTPETDGVLALLNDLARTLPIDKDRIYSTGQSMGGMMSMYYDINFPEIFAASLFVDCHWDESGFDKLVQTPFIFIYAGSKGKAWKNVEAIEKAARKMGKSYTWSEWSAKLPQAEQDALAETQLSKGQPLNIMGFEDGSVLPADGHGSEHMLSFDFAYRLAPVRDWLFKYSLKKGD